MKNKPGTQAMVAPFPGADADMRAHAGKVVRVVALVPTAMGADPAWRTDPQLRDEFGNTVAWHDDDLIPLHGNPDKKPRVAENTSEA